jgi:ATP adenylyltransferase
MNKDDTDFRKFKSMYENSEKDCPFCNVVSPVKARNSMAIAFDDNYPVVKYHTLVTPIRHVSSFFELASFEYRVCILLINDLRDIITKNDRTVAGFNIGVNDGIDAGQTVFHCHIHVTPRRKGDVTNPSGGIRNIIPATSKY